MYKILVPKAVSEEPIECDRYTIGDKGVSYNAGESIGFIPHGNFGAILPVVEVAEPGANTIKL
jgi:hypothetical protein